MLHMGWKRRQRLERQRKSKCHAAHDSAYIQHFYASHDNGERRDDQYLPGILIFHPHTDLFLRQCNRHHSYEDHIHFCILDAAHIPRGTDSQQHQRHLYADMLYL